MFKRTFSEQTTPLVNDLVKCPAVQDSLMILTGSVSTWRLGADRSQEERNSAEAAALLITLISLTSTRFVTSSSNVSLGVHASFKLVNL